MSKKITVIIGPFLIGSVEIEFDFKAGTIKTIKDDRRPVYHALEYYNDDTDGGMCQTGTASNA